MPAEDNQLMLPPAVFSDPNAFEILRVWAANGKQHVVIHSGLHGGPEGFGYMLAQLAFHGARVFHQREGAPVEEALERIRAGLDEEWDNPTGDPEGGILK
jgi:hypothetical protein